MKAPLIFALGGALLIQSGAAQTPERVQQPPIRTQANYVRVDVYPLVGGRPVPDLRAEDFEVFEDDVRQVVRDFEYISVAPAGPQALRAEPNSVEASRQAAADAHNRVFVLFLDVGNVSIEGTWNVQGALVKLVERILGPQDLVGIMTPDMSPAQVTFARRTEVVEAALTQTMPWGTRRTMHEDERERLYRSCFPLLTQEVEQGMSTPEIVLKMTSRRRERLTLDALRDLSVYMRTLREGRTAVITVTEGWLLYRPDPSMTRLRKDCACREYGGDPRTCRGCRVISEEQIPGNDPIGIGPGGKLGRGQPAEIPMMGLRSDCDTERMGLAQMDNEVYFRTILDDANRANVSFYTVDPRGLAAWDAPLGPEKPPTPVQDQANLKARHEAMRNMAVATDGLAVMGGNDLDVGLKRVADDLTSYYLLGYYSTNPKLDGRFRKITVRVHRPGVDVRARRGYRAPTETEIAAARAAAPAEPVSAAEAARTSAIAALARIRLDARFRIHAAIERSEGDGVSRIWIAGELQPFLASDPWSRGGTADLEATSGGTPATARVTLAAGERTFLARIDLPKPARAAIDVRARLAGADPGAARLADSVHVPVDEAGPQALLFRRGPTTGNRYLPAATFLFSRTERIRIELPLTAEAKVGTARLLERGGKTLPVPVTVGERAGDAGTRWMTGELTLAPLGAGEYVIEVALEGRSPVFTAIRVVR